MKRFVKVKMNFRGKLWGQLRMKEVTVFGKMFYSAYKRGINSVQ